MIPNKANKNDKDKQKYNFMEAIHSAQEVIKTTGSMLTKGEFDDFFKDMDLSRQQQEMVYQYLQKTQKETEDENSADTEFDAETRLTIELESDIEIELPDTAFFRLYLEDVQQISQCTKAEEEHLYQRLIAGDETSVHMLSEQWMPKVLKIAKKKMTAADPKEFADIIQEGNMEVFLVLQQMLGSGKRLDFEKELAEAAQSAMEEYMHKTAADADMDQSLLAKAALIYEAQKFLAGQLQRLPSIAELSQYTKLPETELEDILAILENKRDSL